MAAFVIVYRSSHQQELGRIQLHSELLCYKELPGVVWLQVSVQNPTPSTYHPLVTKNSKNKTKSTNKQHYRQQTTTQNAQKKNIKPTMVLGAFVITQIKLSRIFNGSFAISELSLDHCAQLFSAIKGERGMCTPWSFWNISEKLLSFNWHLLFPWWLCCLQNKDLSLQIP